MRLYYQGDIIWLNLTNDFRTSVDFLDICFNKRAVTLLWNTGHTLRNYYINSIDSFNKESSFQILPRSYVSDYNMSNNTNALLHHQYDKRYDNTNNYLIVDLDLIFFTDLYLS